MHCGFCGAQIGPHGACIQCGRPAQQPQVAQPPAQPQQPYAQQPYAQPQQPYAQQPYAQQPGYPPQPYAQQPYPQQPGYPPPQGYPPPPQGYPPPPQGYPPPPYIQHQQVSGLQWKWGYSRLYGIHYGPIPVGVIIVLIIFACYYGSR